MIVNHEDRLNSVWRDRDGHLWRTIGVITDPAVVIERVDLDSSIRAPRETHVLGSPNMLERFTELRPVDSPAPRSEES